MTEYVKATESMRTQLSAVFTDAFYPTLKFFSKDKTKLAAALAHMFKIELFYATTIDGEIAAITACTDGQARLVSLDKNELVRHLGFFMGRFAYAMLNKFLANHTYPFEFPADTGSIEFVAVAEKHRGKGAAHGLIQHIINTTPYKDYILEVAGKNSAAQNLYKKLGFAEFTRTTAPFGSGEKHFVYMKKQT